MLWPLSHRFQVSRVYYIHLQGKGKETWRKFRVRLPPYYSIYCNHTTQNGTSSQTDILMIHSSTSIHPRPFTRIHSIMSMRLSRHMYSPTPFGIVLVITRNNPQVPCTNLPGKPRLQLPNIPMQVFAMQAFDWFRFVQKEPSHSPAHLSVLYKYVTVTYAKREATNAIEPILNSHSGQAGKTGFPNYLNMSALSLTINPQYVRVKHPP